MECRKEIVGQAGGKPCNAIGSCRRNEKEIDGLSDEDVVEGAFEITTRAGPLKHIQVDFVPGKSSECQWRYELRCCFGHQNRDINATILQAPDNFRRLVARNSTADAEGDYHSSRSSSC